MKKLILILALLIFTCIGSFGQYQQKSTEKRYDVPDPNSIPTLNITNNQVYNGWALNGNVCAGCPSYYYMIIRSSNMIRAEDGGYYYYFYFYFYSNSYYSNGTPAGTYLSDIKFYANGNFIFSVPYILVPPGQKVYGAWLRWNTNSPVSFFITNINVH
jgi:hypothetical protein